MIHNFGTQYWVQIAISYYRTACNPWGKKNKNLYFIALEKQTNIKTYVLAGPGQKSHLVLRVLKCFTTQHYVFPDFNFCIQIRLHWKREKRKSGGTKRRLTHFLLLHCQILWVEQAAIAQTRSLISHPFHFKSYIKIVKFTYGIIFNHSGLKQLVPLCSIGRSILQWPIAALPIQVTLFIVWSSGNKLSRYLI